MQSRDTALLYFIFVFSSLPGYPSARYIVLNSFLSLGLSPSLFLYLYLSLSTLPNGRLESIQHYLLQSPTLKKRAT